MQIIIDISEDWYNYCKDKVKFHHSLDNSDYAIANGTPLPKGHGRLIDESKLSLSNIKFKTEEDHCKMIGILNSAPTIIEADKG